ncbi:uncharacterized protein LOC124207877 [Daphnia pulex]|uniref:uncharacterized protein LOC124207877 n=1 Tax=Daphnia pulex TaxID=6669 RepID=UPI001EE0EA59|nr:uncharacterized protein LOC124207877 [Daphnia pulex]
MYLKLNKFFSCFSLQTGTKLIGLFSLACGLLGFKMAFIDTPYLNPVDAIITPFKNEITTSPYLNGWTIVSTVTIVVTLPLLRAAWKNSYAGYLLPWLFAHPFLVFLGVGSQLHDGIFADEHPIERASSIAASLIASGIEFYMCLVVYSYRKELTEQKKREKGKQRSKTDGEITEPETLLSSYVNVALEKGSPTSTRRSSDFLDPENHKDNDDNSPEVRSSEATIYLNLTKK